MEAIVCEGDFERLVVKYQHQLIGFVRRFTRNRLDAEEVVQDTFVRAHRSLSAMSNEQRLTLYLRPWLYTIARNTALNYVRKRDASYVSIDNVENVVWQPSQLIDSETPETIAIERASLAEVEERLRRLPEHLRETARLRFIEDRSQSQIATACGRPLGTVKSRVRRALQSIQRTLGGETA